MSNRVFSLLSPFQSRRRTSHKSSGGGAGGRRRRLRFESLEGHQLLSLSVLSQDFQTVNFTLSGNLTGSGTYDDFGFAWPIYLSATSAGWLDRVLEPTVRHGQWNRRGFRQRHVS